MRGRAHLVAPGHSWGLLAPPRDRWCPPATLGGGQMGGVKEQWGWGGLSLGFPGGIKGLEACGFGEAVPGGAECGCCGVGFGWTQEGADLGAVEPLDSRLAKSGV